MTAEVVEVIKGVIADAKISEIIFRKKKGSGWGGKISLVLGDRPRLHRYAKHCGQVTARPQKLKL